MLLLFSAFAADPASLRAGFQSSSGWEEIDRKTITGVGEVLVRHKQVGGQDCLEGSTRAALDADALLAAATDVRGQPKWSSHDVVASVKLTSGASSFDYYQVLDNPSPVADRYWFVHGTSGVVGNDRVFTWDQLDAGTKYPQQVAEVLAKYPGAVSTTVNLGDWTFTPDGTETKIRYRICTDAGGNIPGWMGQIAARSTLPTNVADIVREVKRRTGG